MVSDVASAANPFTVNAIRQPVSTGLKLWWASITTMVVYSAIAALVADSVLAYEGSAFFTLEGTVMEPSKFASIVIFGTLLLGMCAIGTFLSQKATGAPNAKVVVSDAILRFVPWICTWVVVWFAIGIGYVFLILPGACLAIRLFWADEFALMDGDPPWRSLPRSWELTRDTPGIVSFQFRVGLATNLVLFAVGFVVWALVAVAFAMLPGEVALALTNFLLPLGFLIVYGAFHAMQLTFFHAMREWQDLD